MAFNLQQQVLPQLPVGNYRATLSSWEDSSDQKGDRLTLHFQFPDRVQKLTVFPTNLEFWTTGLSRQLGHTSPMTMEEVLNDAEGEEFDLYLTHYNGFVNLSPYLPAEQTAADPQTPVLDTDTNTAF